LSNPYAATLPTSPDLAQQRKRAKELLKAVSAGESAALARMRYGHPRLTNAADSDLRTVKLHEAQWVIAREYGFSSWNKLRAHIDEIAGAKRRPYRLFETNLQYYRDRAGGLLSMLSASERNALRLMREFHPHYSHADDADIRAKVTRDDAEAVLAREHGFSSWSELAARIEALKADPSIEPFRLAFEAIEAKDEGKLAALLKQHPSLAHSSGTNGNQLLHFAVNHDNPRLTGLLLEAGADPDAANDKGATPLTQAAYGGKVWAIDLLLAEGASVDAEAYGDGGTPLALALFWGHREAAERLAEIAVVPRNLRTAAGWGASTLWPSCSMPVARSSPRLAFIANFIARIRGFRSGTPATIRKKSSTRHSVMRRVRAASKRWRFCSRAAPISTARRIRRRLSPSRCWADNWTRLPGFSTTEPTSTRNPDTAGRREQRPFTLRPLGEGNSKPRSS
jgi:hypothetical protein